MKRIRFGQGFTVFVVFFGVAVLDAIRSFHWLRIIFWLGMGVLFIVADGMRKGRESN